MSDLERVHLNADEPNDEFKLYGRGPCPKKKPGVVRIWVDGCFDMLHFGHTNAMRQSRSLGHELFVGSHTDEEIQKYKGPPIMNAQERYEALRNCKWVDYVVEDYPYVTRLKDIDRFEIDYVAHGDDISVDLNGRNSYQDIIDAGRFKVVKRTAGISTTDLVGRMLLCTKNHMLIGAADDRNNDEIETEIEKNADKTAHLRYLTTSRKIVQFSNNTVPKPTDKVVYVDGAFDLFHIGQMRVLEAAKKLGNYLIIGIHEDDVVHRLRGKNYPIMNMNERVLGVLSSKFVDEVVMGVPFHITEDLIKSLGVHIVAAGKLLEYDDNEMIEDDAFSVPKKMGIFHHIESCCDLTTDSLIERVMLNRAAFMKRQSDKKKKDNKSEKEKPDEYKDVKEVC